MLPRRLEPALSEEERAKWRIVRLDTMERLPGEIVEADIDSGVAKMRERGPDKAGPDGVSVPTWETRVHTLGPGGIAIVRRR
jgi:hypothetical protein